MLLGDGLSLGRRGCPAPHQPSARAATPGSIQTSFTLPTVPVSLWLLLSQACQGDMTFPGSVRALCSVLQKRPLAAMKLPASPALQPEACCNEPREHNTMKHPVALMVYTMVFTSGWAIPPSRWMTATVPWCR